MTSAAGISDSAADVNNSVVNVNNHAANDHDAYTHFSPLSAAENFIISACSSEAMPHYAIPQTIPLTQPKFFVQLTKVSGIANNASLLIAHGFIYKKSASSGAHAEQRKVLSLWDTSEPTQPKLMLLIPMPEEESIEEIRLNDRATHLIVKLYKYKDRTSHFVMWNLTLPFNFWHSCLLILLSQTDDNSLSYDSAAFYRSEFQHYTKPLHEFLLKIIDQKAYSIKRTVGTWTYDNVAVPTATAIGYAAAGSMFAVLGTGLVMICLPEMLNDGIKWIIIDAPYYMAQGAYSLTSKVWKHIENEKEAPNKK